MILKAIDLIRFLLPPPSGKIHALNSPFGQETFHLHMADNWVRRGKATIIGGVLVFRDSFAERVQHQAFRDSARRIEDEAYERAVDAERSASRTTQPSIGV